MSSLFILGSGYTGRYLYAAATARGSRVWATSRNPDTNLSDLPPHARLTFDLERRETWPLIPPESHVMWCFPARPLTLVRDFAAARLTNIARLVVLGSTSAYRLPDPLADCLPPWIDETMPIDETQPRVQGEEYLRAYCGAVVLRTAGIYGPGRNPLDWIRQQRVGYSDRYVNLIHVEDLAGICLDLCEQEVRGEIYNVSDGMPRTWNEICRQAQDRWGIPAIVQRTGDNGKRIAIDKLQRRLNYRFKYPDLYHALALLEPHRLHP
jgi:nucleoside-diphosphate-sugar epimerase